MAYDYTKNEFIEKLNCAGADIATFYKQDFINYLGCTKDTNELYSEIVAGWCFEHLSLFQHISKITRTASYKIETHDGVVKNTLSNRTEELIAMRMFRQGELPVIGKVLDYQTPLKNKRTDKAGKIDLLAYDGSTLRILELKEPDSKETMLRCVLECYTYLQIVDIEKLLQNFGLPIDTNVAASPFVFRDGQQHREMSEQRPCLKRLMTQLNIKPIYISKDKNERYTVTEDEQ